MYVTPTYTHRHSPSACSIFSSDNSPLFQACENNFAFAFTFSNTSSKSDGFIVNGKSLRTLITATPPTPSTPPCSLLFLLFLLLFVYCCFGRLVPFACFRTAPPSLGLCPLFMCVFLSVCPTDRLSASLSICPSLYLYVCLLLYLMSVSLCLCQSLCPSVALSVLVRACQRRRRPANATVTVVANVVVAPVVPVVAPVVAFAVIALCFTLIFVCNVILYSTVLKLFCCCCCTFVSLLVALFKKRVNERERV